MTLTKYRRKRNFKTTSEPFGKARSAGAKAIFVIQKHAASHLHYDFRLEYNGVLLSWAVPKGPSLNPKDKRLAVQVEDHPLEYAGFEGTIPAGEYGGGSVIVWDNGTWKGEDPDVGLAQGKLRIELSGHKLRGAWALVRMGGATGGKNWLLIKENDKFASTQDITEAAPESVLSGKKIEEIGDEASRSQRSKRNKKNAKKISAAS